MATVGTMRPLLKDNWFQCRLAVRYITRRGDLGPLA